MPGLTPTDAFREFTACADSFAAWLSGLGHTACVVRTKRGTVRSFARWAVRKQLCGAEIDEARIHSFLAKTGRLRIRTRPTPRRYDLLQFLRHLRDTGKVAETPPPRDITQAGALLERYAEYLRVERGLVQTSISRYISLLRGFARTAPPDEPTAEAAAQRVRDFLLARVPRMSPLQSRLLGTALRSFLRFRFLRGETAVDLSLTVPSIRRWSLAGVHPYLAPEEVESVLSTCDRTTATGCRDHAILLLLARLGMRACEVANLDLEDLRWRSGEILVHGKSHGIDRLPLLPDVGAALVLYLKRGRPRSPCRKVFLRQDAPLTGLRRNTVSGVVRFALARAGLRRPRGGSHILRHSLATTMLRHGASMAEIGEVLRHRSPGSTALYAKVDFEALRTVALPWPSEGGAL
jgi:integrase/recombinase XerD